MINTELNAFLKFINMFETNEIHLATESS